MIISGTGNRELYTTEEELRQAILEIFEKEQPTKIISGMAIGFDQIFAEVAVKHQVPFIAAVPIAEQASVWPAKAQEKYLRLLELASEVIIVSDSPYAAWKLHARNEWMVNNSDALVVYNNKTDGGAVACLNYAKKQSKRIIELSFYES